MDQKTLTYYIDRYREGTIDQQEWEHLRQLLQNPQYQQQLRDLMDEQLEQDADTDSFYPEVVSRIQLQIAGQTDTRPVRMRKIWWAAAAVLLLLAAAGTYFLTNRPNTTASDVAHVMDAHPGTNKAVLTLADGSEVKLDSTAHQVIQQGATAIHQQGGRLQYEAQNNDGTLLSYNTLRTPRGGQFQLCLPDGTQVWLNAASSIKYPTAFAGKERRVQITGEAYFEVAKNVQMPFKVEINGQAEVEVLGTHFNISSYTDESSIDATLLEGAISIQKGKERSVLHPGQQAQIDNKEGINVIKNADIEKVMAWKNGHFNFEGVQLEEVMRQISRWYDIEVVYEKGIPNVEFAGKMSRNVPLSMLLKGFQGFDVHFRVEQAGRRVIVTP